MAPNKGISGNYQSGILVILSYKVKVPMAVLRPTQTGISMESNSTNEFNDDWIIIDHHWVQAVFSLTHGLTLACIAVFAKMIRHRVEIAHPVFAVIFQEVLVMLFLEMSGLVLTVLLAAYPENSMLIVLYAMPPYASLNFHQVSWLVVTYLRY